MHGSCGWNKLVNLSFRHVFKFNIANYRSCLYSKPCVAGTRMIEIGDKRQIPQLGLGTMGMPNKEVEQVVKDAIDVGYRHFDCAHVYENELGVGAGLHAKIEDRTVKREELWVTSKLWNTSHRPDLVRKACEYSLNQLGLDYLDLYLIQTPMAFKEDTDDLFPTDACGKIIFSTTHYIETWKEMEKLRKCGLCKSIGLSNFNKRQVLEVLRIAKIPPAINQVECHPYLTQMPLREFCKSRNIAVAAYGPLGSPKRWWALPNDPVLLEDKKLVHLAKKKKKTPAQILIRFHVQLGNIVIVKAANKSHMESNMNVYDFQLTNNDYLVLKGLDRDLRFVGMEKMGTHPHHPFIYDKF